MTPEEARAHLAWPEDKDHPKVRDGSGQTWFEVQAGESHPYWNRLPDAPYEDAVMYAVARAALATIAGMTFEYGVHWPATDDFPAWTSWGFDTIEKAREHNRELTVPPETPGTILRRYVTEPEEA